MKRIGRISIIGLCLASLSWPGVALGQTAPSASTATPSTPGTPINYTVPDCPGITRSIDASHLPPSIYPKPNCAGGPTNVTNGNLGTPAGKYGTGTGAPAAGTLFWVITGGKQYDITQGYGMTDFAQTYPHNDDGTLWYGYCDDYQVPGHCGVDVGTPSGTQVYTPVAGKVICAGTGVALDASVEPCTAYPSTVGTPGENGRFQLELSNGDMLIFGHMSKITVKPGDQLTAGAPVGLTGSFNGDHFHLEYRHPSGDGWITYDPRDMFDVPSNGVTAKTLGAAISRLTSAIDSKVLADTAMASTMAEFQSKYGFMAPSGPGGVDISKYSAAFATLRDWAIKAGGILGVEPQLIAWWTLVETSPPYDSYHYSNCHDYSDEHLRTKLDEACDDDSWQIGYGEQWSHHTLLGEAFKQMRGNPDDAAAVQKIGQEVLQKSEVTATFPSVTATSLSSGADRFNAFTLMRDPGVSAYLLGTEIQGDIANAGSNANYMNSMCGWDGSVPYYCLPETMQTFANGLNDVITNWGIASTGSTGVGCTTTTGSTASSCSTVTDNLQGMSAEDFTTKINANMASYKTIAECGDVPWQMMAAIHMQETALDPDYQGKGLTGVGSWQIDTTNPIYKDVDPHNFEEAGCALAKHLQTIATLGPVGKPLRSDMKASEHEDEVSIKDTLFGYQGRNGFESNIDKGCTPDVDGHKDWDFDCSAFVMNNWDTNHTGMCYQETVCPELDGAWKIFYKLNQSTYDGDGKLQVYGGQCNLNVGVINGIATPTDSNHIGISSHFFEGGHIGIDIKNSEGSPVFAIADGDVINSGWIDAGGYYVLQHIPANVAGNASERWVYYGHLDPAGYAAVGSQIKAGQQIGTTGPHTVIRNGQEVTNGQQTAPHLHFDIRTIANEGGDPSTHVNPCSIDQFKQFYPEMECDTYGGSGVAWK